MLRTAESGIFGLTFPNLTGLVHPARPSRTHAIYSSFRADAAIDALKRPSAPVICIAADERPGIGFAGRVHEIHSTIFAPLIPFLQQNDNPGHAGCLEPRDSAARIPRAGRFAAQKRDSLTSFNDFGLAEPILRALAEEKYLTPTPIQAQTIPFAGQGRDIVGIAQTGTGKTAAFALPILNHLHGRRQRPDKKSCRVLVLSPTRELSGQIAESFRAYGRHIRPLTIALAIGGVPINKQIRSLAHGAEVLVATPGRLLDLVHQRALRLDRVEVLVLDEADRMLDMGFVRDIKKVVAMLPRERQTLFFSATMPQEIARLADQMLRDPARVSVAPQATTAERVRQKVIHIDRPAKPALLAEVLKAEPIDRVLVFTRTKHGADKLVRSLAKSGVAAEAIHGNKSQNQRERVLAAFRAGSLRTLIATDIAARGIDVDGISHVVNYDLPNIPESYVHRIGRTARAGRDGVAISFCDREERAYLRDIERLIRMAIPATDRSGGGGRAEIRSASHGQPGQRPTGRPHRNKHQARRHKGGHGANSGHPQASRHHAGAGEPSGIGNVTFLRHPQRQRRNADGRA
jgi:ATP-dependent RNA helicase RhlE